MVYLIKKKAFENHEIYERKNKCKLIKLCFATLWRPVILCSRLPELFRGFWPPILSVWSASSSEPSEAYQKPVSMKMVEWPNLWELVVAVRLQPLPKKDFKTFS